MSSTTSQGVSWRRVIGGALAIMIAAGLSPAIASGGKAKPEPEPLPPLEKPAGLEGIRPTAQGELPEVSDEPTRSVDATPGADTSSTAEVIGEPNEPVIEPATEQPAPITIAGTSGYLTGKPQTGSVGYKDYADYAIYLNAAQTLSMSLTWPSSAVDVDLFLYDRNGRTVASSAGLAYPETINYAAPSPGWYRIRVFGYSGSSTFTLTWNTTTVTPDDEIPGVAFSASSVTGSFNKTDGVDVYRVYATAGQRLQLWLQGPNGTDFDMALNSPASTSSNNAAHLLRASNSGSSYEGIDYTTPHTGWHYVIVRAWRPVTVSTAYRVGYQINGTTRAMVRAYASPPEPLYGSSVRLQGYVTTLGGVSLPGRQMQLLRGSTVVRSMTTDQYGAFSFLERPLRRTTYIERVASAGDLIGTSSVPISVSPKHVVGMPSMKTSVARRRYYSVSGILKPWHASGTKPVRLLMYRFEAGSWKLKKTIPVKVKSYRGYSKYYGKVLFPTAGKWKVVANAPRCAWHAPAMSKARFVTVNKTTMSARGGGTYTYGKKAKVSGTLRGPGRKVLKGKVVYLEQSYGGTYWSAIKKVKTNSKGVASAYVLPNTDRYYRYRYIGNTKYAPSTSGRVKVTLKPRVVSGTTSSRGTSSRWFTLPSGGCRSIIEGYAGSTDYNIYLYDSKGSYVSSIRTSGNCAWYFNVPKAGKYNLRINSSYPRAPYRLTFQ